MCRCLSSNRPTALLPYTPEALKALAGIVKGGNNMAGITVKLTADIALDPTEEFAPIGSFERNGAQAPFCGTFDGDNHIIGAFAGLVSSGTLPGSNTTFGVNVQSAQ